MHVNKEARISGSGGIPVFDTNLNRTGSEMIYPFVETGSLKNIFKEYKYQPHVKNATNEFFNIRKNWLEVSGGLAENASVVADNGIVTSSYGFESPIQRRRTSSDSSYSANYWNMTSSINGGMVSGESRNYLSDQSVINITASALQNIARKYTTLSDHFIFTSSSVRSRDLVYGVDDINFLFIPSMYFGSTIKKGSVELNYYITGSKVATCADIHHNGTLIETTGSSTGSVVGLVLYDEGIMMLTASHNLENNNIEYDTGGGGIPGTWLTYATTLNDGVVSSATLASASYDLNFKGTSYINSMTMFAHAQRGHLNHSNNPTYQNYQSQVHVTGGAAVMFEEPPQGISNIVSASYTSASFDKVTYISKVHIYDEDGNLIAITSLAKPVKKTLEDEYTFKMKIDL
jgi:hypothetical protein